MKKVAINGFGRIGRAVFKIILDEMEDLEIVAINDLAENEILAYLLKHDSVFGEYNHDISFDSENIIVDGNKIKVFEEKDPQNLPWKDLEVDVVLECTGFFRDREGAEKHLKAGAKKVIISAPAKDDDISSYVIGVNDKDYKGEAVIDMGSCTTNCLAPVVAVLEREFGIEKGFMTTIHSYTANQNLLDGTHKDFRRARAAAINMVPTSTGAAQAIGKVVPSILGKLDGEAIRVPTPTVSIIDLVCIIKKEISVEDLLGAFEKYESEKMKGVLRVEKNPLVSSDFEKSPYSAIVDAELLRADANLVKVLAWYDNEWGYSVRLAEMCSIVALN